MPAKSKSQYGLAQGVLHGSITGSKMPLAVAKEIVEKTPKKKRRAFAAALNNHTSSKSYKTKGR